MRTLSLLATSSRSVKRYRSDGRSQYMLTEQLRLFFLHFWAHDDAVKLAHALRAAVDKTAAGRSG